MIVIFEDDAGGKVNFVDSNDVFVGYDTAQDCCEEAGWFLTQDFSIGILAHHPESDGLQKLLHKYCFDTDYDVHEPVYDSSYLNDLDGGDYVTFRLIAEGQDDIYLVVYNAHNGYYGHGIDGLRGTDMWFNAVL